jgi:protein LSM14
MHNQGFGRGGFPPGPGGPGFPAGPGFPGQQYGPPPGWYPPPGQAFPPGPGQFPPHHQQGPPGAPGQQPPPQAKAQQGGKAPQQAPIGPIAPKDAKADEKKPEPAKAPEPAAAPKKAPTPPIESKPDVAQATAPPATVSASVPAVPTGPKGRVAPVIPRQVPAASKAPVTAQPTAAQSSATSAQTYQNATQAATAAVAAAMAKLPMANKAHPGQSAPAGDSAVDNLTKKVQEMRTDNNIRHSSQPGTGGYVAGHRGGRGGGHRGGRRDHPASKPVEVPTTDYDFEGANAKFNKQDLVKEAIATGSPLGDVAEVENPSNGATNGKTEEKASEDVVIPPAQQAYDKKSSFFDNISSELKDRDDNKRGMEFRNEERKKNMETFGQGSVDNYRGGYRGRGRGRGGYRGRGRGYANAGTGYPARGRGGASGGEGQ